MAIHYKTNRETVTMIQSRRHVLATLLILLLASLNAPAANHDHPQVSWNPKKIKADIPYGQTETFVVTVVSNKQYEAAAIFVNKKLRPYVSVSEETLSLEPNNPQDVHINVKVPPGFDKSRIKGAITLREFRHDRPNGKVKWGPKISPRLPVRIKVIEPDQ